MNGSYQPPSAPQGYGPPPVPGANSPAWQPPPSPASAREGGVDGAARVLVELVSPELADELRRVPGGAVVLGERVVGGRVHIGAPLAALHRTAMAVGIILFGWPYAFLFLRSASSTWSFIPAKRAEFVRFEIVESVALRRVLPALAISIVVGVSTLLFIALLSFAISPLFMVLGVPTAWMACNAVAWLVLREAAPRLLMSQLRMEYGFPEKTVLLDLSCDASMNTLLPHVEEIAGVLDGFGTWNHLSVHGGGAVSVVMNQS
jgi:hypothetical protein